MALYIRDDAVNELADRLAKMTGQSKTQAVREAIELRLSSLPPRQVRPDWLDEVQARARALGIGPDGLDDKDLMDDLSGGL